MAAVYLPLIAAVEPSVLSAIVVAILGGGGVGAFLAYRKTGAEAESIAARTLIEVNEELRTELARSREELGRARSEVEHARNEIAQLRAECQALRARVAVLEGAS